MRISVGLSILLDRSSSIFIYRLSSKATGKVYIGQSCNVLARIGCHMSSKPFNKGNWTLTILDEVPMIYEGKKDSVKKSFLRSDLKQIALQLEQRYIHDSIKKFGRKNVLNKYTCEYIFGKDRLRKKIEQVLSGHSYSYERCIKYKRILKRFS